MEYKVVTEAKAHHRKGPHLWGYEGKRQSSSPIDFKCSPCHRGLGVEDSKLFPRGFYWARLSSLLGNDINTHLPFLLKAQVKMIWRGGDRAEESGWADRQENS